ncbi:MAG TPA: hypothetical protein VGC90_07500 [Candidatus Limnocylindrales bacterium]
MTLADVALVGVIACVVLFAGIVIGMLVQPRIQRWADRHDEEPRDRID